MGQMAKQETVLKAPTAQPGKGAPGQWRLVALTVRGKVTRSYIAADGFPVDHDQKFKYEGFDAPQRCRQAVAALGPREANIVQHVFSFATYVYDSGELTNHGMTAEHIEKEMAVNGYGDNVPHTMTSTPHSEVLRYNNAGASGEELERNGDDVDAIESVRADLRAHEQRNATTQQSNESTSTAKWIAILAIGIVAAAALVIATL